ncbi:unnamed protein product [Aureobasidium mustum]|uniref:Uncharacterized protein n=1 Tax=Aureobasidium mustum TaxID=2773714 RepID=A0A9N8PFZ5_9PEZI|nr:unnamed protein product [Aureobasidium mustum]
MSTNDIQGTTDSNPSRPRAQSTNSFASSFKSPRVARFAEATTVNSPIDPPRSSFIAVPTNHFRPQPQPSDIGFGYIDDKHTSHVTVEMEDTDNNHLPRGRSDAPLSPPLKSAMKTPGMAPRNFGNLMSPTFQEEHVLEKRELATEKEQAKDLRAEKVQTYYTVFAVGFFAFSIVMWGIGAGVLNTTRTNSNGQDIWGWSCKENKRKELFSDVVNYALVCRLQNWSLVCAVIEIVVELCAIGCYSFVFYRIWSKRKLRKSMAVRDRARSDLYLAQLRSQSAPNTPGLNGPLSPRDGGWRPPVDYYKAGPSVEAGLVDNEGIRYVDASQQSTAPKPFVLQPPPTKGTTPKIQQTGFTPLNYTSPADSRSPSPVQAQPSEQQQEHFAAAPGEQIYESVPIPGSYSSPLNSPSVAPRQMSFSRPGGQL